MVGVWKDFGLLFSFPARTQSRKSQPKSGRSTEAEIILFLIFQPIDIGISYGR